LPILLSQPFIRVSSIGRLSVVLGRTKCPAGRPSQNPNLILFLFPFLSPAEPQLLQPGPPMAAGEDEDGGVAADPLAGA
jgi:hypothetical protein